MQHETGQLNQRPFRTERDNVVSFDLPLEAPCPCESGLPTNSCCLTPKGIATKAASTFPPGSKTGYSRQGCYAAFFNDCGSKLSKEHYLSESILKILNQKERGGLRVGGLPWQEGDISQPISPKSLTARILCERHNSALSNLDSMAVRLFRTFDNIAGNTENKLCLFNGHDIERWLLKVLCGMFVSNNLNPGRPVQKDIPLQWIEVLFQARGFDSGQGLYVCCSKGAILNGPIGIALRPLGKENRIVGIGLLVCGFELVLNMKPSRIQELLGRQVAYRPNELHITGPRYEKSVVLSWNEPADKGTIDLKLIDK